jgi:hypothetical protein
MEKFAVFYIGTFFALRKQEREIIIIKKIAIRNFLKTVAYLALTAARTAGTSTEPEG